MFLLYEFAAAFDKLNEMADSSQQVELIQLYFLKRQAFDRRRYKLRDRRVMMAIRMCHESHDDNAEMTYEKEELPSSRHSMLR